MNRQEWNEFFMWTVWLRMKVYIEEIGQCNILERKVGTISSK